MAVTQKSNLILKIIASLTNGLDLGDVVDNLSLDWTVNFGDGAGANAAQQIWHDQRTLNASATENLDLAGSLTNAFGTTLTFTKLKGLFVKAASGNTNNVNVIREGTNGVPLFLALGDGIPVKPGGWFAWVDPSAAGVTVTAATGDLLTFTNSAGGTAVTYDVVIIGATS